MEEAQLRYHRVGNRLAGYGIRIHDIEIEVRKTEEMEEKTAHIRKVREEGEVETEICEEII